jgi:hypothetical protein
LLLVVLLLLLLLVVGVGALEVLEGLGVQGRGREVVGVQELPRLVLLLPFQQQ